MALTAYLVQTQRLLNDENAQFYSTADLTAFINIARNTIASQSECLVSSVALATVANQQSYALPSLSAPSGLLSAINVRSIRSIVGGMGAVLDARPWPWFSNYYLTGTGTTTTGTPTVWSMQNQGSLGNMWLWAIPSGVIALSVEAAWIPIPLVNDSTAENLAYPWTDAVPYFAAYLAYINAQRGQDAQRMLSLFNAFMKAARVGVTAEWDAPIWPALKPLQGAVDPNLAAQNLKPSAGGEGSLG